ncbi:MAG: hypothetical protein P4N24_15535 [Acidobacteriota bacterium]|nr:hypothetical protein [Acidobacteriota bacterium]
MPRDVREFSCSKEQNSLVAPQRLALLWLLFFLICLGLGYPPLNRYDPGKSEGTSDVAEYRAMVVGRTPQLASGACKVFARLAQSEHYYRMLVPYVAKPFYWLARGHVRTWDPALFGLLVANAIFTATTACLLVAIGRRLTLDSSTALLGATLYLLNYCIANLNLVGLVDSAEGCFVMVIVWSLLTGRWFLLPLWGILGALAKESFAPLSLMFVFGWWISEVRRARLQLPRLAWIAALGVASMTTVTLAMSAVAGGLVWPWQFAAYQSAGGGFLAGLRGCILDHTFWYAFIWLLPLGLVCLRRLPRPWVLATAVAFCGALALGAWNNTAGIARPLFNVAGPILSLSAAVFLSSTNNTRNAGPGDPEPGQA